MTPPPPVARGPWRRRLLAAPLFIGGTALFTGGTGIAFQHTLGIAPTGSKMLFLFGAVLATGVVLILFAWALLADVESRPP